ncbi:hypothetical protein CROQUDRAFT_99934 [Cronartium quercuum f. sp. fusiforme G11]|uniref:Uncharacterized protein n=1 Tax=Cronartium quercuum f. sp. fusiforme G11 TaxID=708437 RepID=A0A9P6N6J7_9BASI|nr:hypothetical protein CROQUDRAFT_99934 [Cronartium quercuum f. sp. fusiforme G11]
MSMEDNLMDTWIKAMKHMGTDRNVVLSSTVVKGQTEGTNCQAPPPPLETDLLG